MPADFSAAIWPLLQVFLLSQSETEDVTVTAGTLDIEEVADVSVLITLFVLGAKI